MGCFVKGIVHQGTRPEVLNQPQNSRSAKEDKKLCLLERLLEEAGHEDTGLVEDIKRGFDLTGALPRSGVFNQKFRPASMTCEDLRKVSNLSRDVLLESVQSSGDKEIDLSLFTATLKEVEKGFIKGPTSKEEIPAGSTLTKWFPLKQKNKVRPIDDYKASLVNFAVAQNERVTIHTIDHIASMIAFWMKSGSLNVKDGLVAKCWDLSDAYKQVPLSDEAFHLDSYLAVYGPGCSSAKIFKQCVLPFGSTASVAAFLRVSLALWKVGSFVWQEAVSRSMSNFASTLFSHCWDGGYPRTSSWTSTPCAKSWEFN